MASGTFTQLIKYRNICYAALRAEVQTRLHQNQDYPCEVVGSWNTWYGEQDQAGKQQSQQDNMLKK